MGVMQLWNLLKESSVLKVIEGETEHGRIVAEAEGKVIAVDLSVWICEATQQMDIRQAFEGDDSTLSLKVVFERVCR